MKPGISVVVLSVAIAGCATSKSTYLPDGRKGHSIECNGSAGNWGMCERKAGDLCRERGYDVLSANQDGHPFSFASAQTGQSSSVMIVNRTMLIACK